MCFSSPSVPTVTYQTPQESDESVTSARNNERQRRLAAAGQNTTLVTGGSGVSGDATTGLKTAFGA